MRALFDAVVSKNPERVRSGKKIEQREKKNGRFTRGDEKKEDKAEAKKRERKETERYNMVDN